MEHTVCFCEPPSGQGFVSTLCLLITLCLLSQGDELESSEELHKVCNGCCDGAAILLFSL